MSRSNVSQELAAPSSEMCDSSKKNLLFLTHRIPYPPNKGDKIRSFNLLKHLTKYYSVHLATFIDDPHDWRYVPEVEAMCASSHFSPLNGRMARLRSLTGFFSNMPLTLPYYRCKTLAAWVDERRRNLDIPHILVFSSAMAQYADDTETSDVHRVIDFVDVDSEKWAQYAKHKNWPMSWVYGRESRALLDYERDVAQKFDASIFVSENEADLFKQLAPGAAGKVTYIDNGVDTDYFSPEGDYINPYEEPGPVLVFTGAMDYWANVDAVDWFARQVFPRVRQRVPNARFYIVGARPQTQVRSLGDLPGVTVTGAVHDIRPYLAHAEAAVAPLRIARGVQNKVLEAMAMAKLVIATAQAVEGLDSGAVRTLMVADDVDGYAACCVDALTNGRNGLGKEARKSVLRAYNWTACLERLTNLLGASSASPTTPQSFVTQSSMDQGRP